MFLMEKLHEFFSEVLSVRSRLASGALTADAARKELRHTLARQHKEAERLGGHYGADRYNRARYAFAALADEMFLDGPTEKQWEKLLEADEFQSQCAGEKVFTDIDALQSERGPDTDEIARVYLAVLGLGFVGRFEDQPGAEKDLQEYRDKLHRIIFGRDPEPMREDEQIAPSAYRDLIDAGAARTQLPYLRPWILTLVAIFVVYLLASHVLWRTAVGPLEDHVETILARETATTTHVPATQPDREATDTTGTIVPYTEPAR